jgi:alpha-ribazole phosphatase
MAIHPSGPLYLVRHGEAEGNAEHRYIGWSDPPLTQRGEAQAAVLADLLRREPITRVVASDRQRAIATAQPIAAGLGLTPATTAALRELHFGRWEGRTPDELWAAERERYDGWLQEPEREAPPEGEGVPSLRGRIRELLACSQAGELWVTHGGPIRLILAEATGAPFWSCAVPPGSAWRLVKGRVNYLGPSGNSV